MPDGTQKVLGFEPAKVHIIKAGAALKFKRDEIILHIPYHHR